MLIFCFGCWVNDKCLSPDCEHSSEFRFNLIDESGIDVVFDNAHQYEVADIAISDKQGVDYHVKGVKITSSDKVLIVNLDGHVNQYDLLLYGNTIDTFLVSFRETEEECCGKTYWINNVEFSSLDTSLPSTNIGSLHIKIN